MFTFCANKMNLMVMARETLVSESSNIYRCSFALSDDWEGLTAGVYFRAGDVIKKAEDFDGRECTIPWEVLAAPDIVLEAGLRGTDGDTVVLPTIWATLGRIHAGTGNNENILPIVPSEAEKILREIESAKTEAVEAANHPPIPGENGFWMVWNSKTGQYELTSYPLPQKTGNVVDALPEASATYRGLIYVVKGTTTDRVFLCLLSGGSYKWREISFGGKDQTVAVLNTAVLGTMILGKS